MESWVSFSGKAGHKNSWISAQPEIELVTVWLEGRDLTNRDIHTRPVTGSYLTKIKNDRICFHKELNWTKQTLKNGSAPSAPIQSSLKRLSKQLSTAPEFLEKWNKNVKFFLKNWSYSRFFNCIWNFMGQGYNVIPAAELKSENLGVAESFFYRHISIWR